MTAEDDGPATNRAATNPDTTAPDSSVADDLRADLELRIAWLRVHADLLYAVDSGGMLSAHLRDRADLLDVLQREGRWDR